MGLLNIMRAEGDPRRVMTVVGSRFYACLVLSASVLASLAARPSSGNEEGAAAWRNLPAWSLQSLEYAFVAHATSGMLSLTVRARLSASSARLSAHAPPQLWALQRNATAASHIGLLAFLSSFSAVHWRLGLSSAARLDSFGNLFQPLTYVSWLFTTPCMLLLLAELAHATPQAAATTILLDMGMLACGAAGQLLPPSHFSFSLLCMVLSICLWVPLMLSMNSMFRACASRAEAGSQYARAVELCWSFTLSLWGAFPALWLMGATGLLSLAGQTAGWVVLDVCAKCAFAFTLLHAHTVTLDESVTATTVAVARARARQLAHLCHEIRNPLNGIMGNLQEMEGELEATRRRGGAKGASVEGLVETSLACAAQLRRSLDDMLDLEKASASAMRVERAPVLLRALLRDTLRQVSRAARQKGLRLRAELPPALAQRAYLLDNGRVQQVLANYLWNAVKCTGAGGVTLGVCAEQGPAGGDSLLRFCVSDSGPGIGSDAAARIFQPFQQERGGAGAAAVRAAEAAYGGSGLGLAICRVLAELMDGSVGFATSPAGSAFWLRLPSEWWPLGDEASEPPCEFEAQAEEAEAEERGVQPPPAQREPERASDWQPLEAAAGPPPAAPLRAPWPGALRRLLVVDDEPVNAALIARRLQRELPGVEVVLLEDGAEMVELTVKGGAAFDIVLMDQHMRGMNGDAAVAALREHERAQRLPRSRVVAWTGNDGDLALLAAAGFDGVVSKPLDMSALVPLLHALVTADCRSDLPAAVRGNARLFSRQASR